MTEDLKIPAFLDRNPKGTPMPEQKAGPASSGGSPAQEPAPSAESSAAVPSIGAQAPAPPRKKAVLKLVVEFDELTAYDMSRVKELIETARGLGTVRSAKITGLPTSANLA